MTFDVNHYLSKTYGPQPCWELVADVYNTEVGEIPVDYKTINRSVREMASAFRLAIHGSPHGFSQIEIPTDLCIVSVSMSAFTIVEFTTMALYFTQLLG